MVQTATDTFEISTADVLPGKNIMEFVPKPIPALIDGGIKASDILQLRKALTEIITLDPSSIIRADGNYSNFVGVEDFVLLINRILGVEPNFFDLVFIHSDLDLTGLDLFDFGMDVY